MFIAVVVCGCMCHITQGMLYCASVVFTSRHENVLICRVVLHVLCSMYWLCCAHVLVCCATCIGFVVLTCWCVVQHVLVLLCQATCIGFIVPDNMYWFCNFFVVSRLSVLHVVLYSVVWNVLY